MTTSDDSGSFDLDDFERAAKMLRIYGVDVFGPPNERGQVHFGMAMIESAADAIDEAATEIKRLRALLNITE